MSTKVPASAAPPTPTSGSLVPMPPQQPGAGGIINREEEGGLPVNVIAEVLKEKGLDIKDVASCVAVIGGNSPIPSVDLFNGYARIPAEYRIQVGGKELCIKSYIYTNIKVPLGGSAEDRTDFDTKIASTVFFAKQQVRSIFQDNKATAPDAYQGAVDRAIVAVALANPTFRFTIETKPAGSQIQPQEAHTYYELDLSHAAGSGASPQASTAQTVHLLVEGAEGLLKKMHERVSIPVGERVRCQPLEDFEVAKKCLEEKGSADFALKTLSPELQKLLFETEFRTAEKFFAEMEKGKKELETLLAQWKKMDASKQQERGEIRALFEKREGELRENFGKTQQCVERLSQALRAQPQGKTFAEMQGRIEKIGNEMQQLVERAQGAFYDAEIPSPTSSPSPGSSPSSVVEIDLPPSS